MGFDYVVTAPLLPSHVTPSLSFECEVFFFINSSGCGDVWVCVCVGEMVVQQLVVILVFS